MGKDYQWGRFPPLISLPPHEMIFKKSTVGIKMYLGN